MRKEKREIRYYSNNQRDPQNYIIEGIGGAFGLEEPYYYLGLGFANEGEFNCYSDSNTVYYGKCNYPSFVTSVNQINKSKLENFIYSNPTTDKLYIDEEAHYKVCDMSGKIVLQGHGISIDVSSLSKQMYLLTVTNSTGQEKRSRFIKE